MKFKILMVLSLLIFLGTANAVTKIACVGDSITWGYNSTDGSSTGFEPGLQKLLGSNYSIQNDGYSGATAVRKDNKGKSYWTCGKLTDVWAYKPNIITIMLGTNDSRPELFKTATYTADYNALIDTLNTISTKPRIIIAFPPPNWRTGTAYPSDANIVLEIAILKQIAKTRGLQTVDQHTPLLPFQKYFKDNLHPNAAGYDTLAHVFARGILSTTSIDPATESNQLITSEANHFSMILSSIGALANLDSKLVPGVSYSVQAFDMKGALLARSTVKNAQDTKMFAQGLQVGSRGLKVLEFNRVMQ